MAQNTNRGLFTLSGITGMLIATGLLLGILAYLSALAIDVQRAESTKPYDPTPIVSSLDNVKMISTDNLKVMQQVWGKE
jgi:hypothetical protein